MTMAEVRETAFHRYSLAAPALLTHTHTHTLAADMIRMCLTKTNWTEFMQIEVTGRTSADFYL